MQNDMGANETKEVRSEAIDHLTFFGLSAYAARTFVALVGRGPTTAREVSQVADVPRTRVYDAIDELGDHGLVHEQPTSPKQFWVVSAESTARYFRHELSWRIGQLTEAIESLESGQSGLLHRGVCRIRGRESVTDRVGEAIADATEELIYVSSMDPGRSGIADELTAAARRGCTVHFGEIPREGDRSFHSAGPEITTFEMDGQLAKTPTTRIALVDGRLGLMGVDGPTGQGGGTESTTEVAITGVGEGNALVVLLTVLLNERIPDQVDIGSTE